MRVGIDFGTTHTVAAIVDRGNYPVVYFDGVDTWPSLVAGNAAGELRFGLDAAAVRREAGWSVVRSFKHLLNNAGPRTEVTLSGRIHRSSDLLTGFLVQLKSDLVRRANVELEPGERIEAAISVPANASSAQRFLTLDAFLTAGFEVVVLLNEPSAAGFEYAHRYRSTITGKREYVVIYDLGGGTFDASLVKMTGRWNEVVTSEGIQRLGGDDFDEMILKLVLTESKLLHELDPTTRDLLLEECTARKEAVGPNTRRFLVDLSEIDRPPLSRPIEDVYAACAPLVDKTVEVLTSVLRDPARHRGHVEWSEIAGIYTVGGAAGFPLVGRMLRKSFGEKRVKRSPHPFAATAIGLAAFLDKEAGFALSDRFSRHFGVFREAHSGEDVVFDPSFRRTFPCAGGEPPLVVTRKYRAVHNIGHFRFVECSRLTDGRPDGDVTPYDPVFFPFDPDLHDEDDLRHRPVGRREFGPDVEECYTLTPSGAVEVIITTRPAGLTRTFRLARHVPASL